MPCQTWIRDAGGPNHRYYVHTYTLHLPSLSFCHVHMKIWRSFKVVFRKKKQRKASTNFHIKITTTSWGAKWWTRRGKNRVEMLLAYSDCPLFSFISLFSFCKLNKMPEASEKASRVDLSRLLVDPTWLKSNLIKCIAGILRK